MAGLVKCASCKREISHTARVCPFCGDSDYEKRERDKYWKDTSNSVVKVLKAIIWFFKKNSELIKDGFANYRVLTLLIIAFYISSFVYFYYNAENIENGKNGYVALSITFLILGQLVIIGITELIKKIKSKM